MKRVLIITAAITLLLTAAASTGLADPPPGKGGGKGDDGAPPDGTVYALQAGAATLLEIATDGSSGTPIPCPGHADLSHGLIGGERYFVWAEDLADPHPSGWEAAEVFAIGYGAAFTEPCATVQLTDFFNQSAASVTVPIMPRWSPDGGMLAFLAFNSATYDANHQDPVCQEDGWACPLPYDLWVANVSTAGGLALDDVRVLVAGFGAANPLSWSPDSRFIVTAKARPYGRTGVFAADTATGAVHDISPDSSRSEFQPAFSPIADRVAFLRIADKGDSLRNEIWVGDLTLDGQGAPQPLSGLVQVTNKKNFKPLGATHPTWSPDGEHIAVTGEDGGWLTALRRLYRIRADGKGKAVLLSAFDDTAEFNTSVWRNDPTG